MKKIPTLFERVFDGHKIVDILPNVTDGCEDAFKNGIATVKVDGSCCAVINGEFYKRYDAKAGKPIPEGAIPCQEPDPVTGHLPCWVKCNREDKGDKWFWKAYDATFTNNDITPENGTYEAIGRHFNGNPYMLATDILEKHGTDIIDGLTRDFESIREYLKEHYIEGIVFWLDDKPVCKIKRSDFGFEWNKKRK